MEIFDPEQNKNFVDNYMDFPVDLSNVLFVCTANSLEGISAPLKDRMVAIELNSYTNSDKEHIYKNHLYKQAVKSCGLEAYQDLFEINENIIQPMIVNYC